MAERLLVNYINNSKILNEYIPPSGVLTKHFNIFEICKENVSLPSNQKLVFSSDFHRSCVRYCSASNPFAISVMHMYVDSFSIQQEDL